MQKMRLFSQYGGMKPGTYNVVSQERDHNVVKWRGHNYVVPNVLFTPDDRPSFVERYDEDEEEYYE